MIPEISMVLRQQAALGYPTFPVITSLFRVHFGKPCSDSSPQPDTRNSCGMPRNAFENPSVFRKRTAFLFKKCVRKKSYSCVWRTCVSKRRETTQSFTIPTLRLAGNVSTWNPPSLAEGPYPQNYMVEQPRNQISEMPFAQFPTPSTFQCWKTSFKTEVRSWSNYPSEAMRWKTRWTILRRRNLFDEISSQISRCLMQISLPL